MSKLYLGRKRTTLTLLTTRNTDNQSMYGNATHNKYIFVLTTAMNTCAIAAAVAAADSVAATLVFNRHVCDHIYAIIAIIVEYR